MKKGRLVYDAGKREFRAVESVAAAAKRVRREVKEAEEREAEHLRGAVGKSSALRRRGPTGLYYLLAAIEFVETR